MSIILAIGTIVGIVFVIMLDEATKEIIFLNINEMIQNTSGLKINNIFLHLVSLSSLLILSLFIVGAPLNIFFLFYNGFSAGFIITSLTYIFGIKGLLYSIIYLIISKGLFLVALMIFLVTLFKIIKNLIDKIIYKTKGKDLLIVLCKKALLCLAFILFTDILLYFGGAKLINIFNFLII